MDHCHSSSIFLLKNYGNIKKTLPWNVFCSLEEHCKWLLGTLKLKTTRFNLNSTARRILSFDRHLEVCFLVHSSFHHIPQKKGINTIKFFPRGEGFEVSVSVSQRPWNKMASESEHCRVTTYFAPWGKENRFKCEKF